MVKQVLIWRDDLRTVQGGKLPKGKISAQLAHASLLSIRNNLVEEIDGMQIIDLKKFPEYEIWDRGEYKKVCLKVSSLEELLKIESLAKEKGLITALVVDNGHTCFNGEKTITCLAIGPSESIKIDEITGNLRLLQ